MEALGEGHTRKYMISLPQVKHQQREHGKRSPPHDLDLSGQLDSSSICTICLDLAGRGAHPSCVGSVLTQILQNLSQAVVWDLADISDLSVDKLYARSVRTLDAFYGREVEIVFLLQRIYSFRIFLFCSAPFFVFFILSLPFFFGVYT